uniref:Uncharacterized protein n=1 Tax=Anopheles culicifacies TaxID=139723 RepID=A0A182MAA8_9DIPT
MNRSVKTRTKMRSAGLRMLADATPTTGGKNSPAGQYGWVHCRYTNFCYYYFDPFPAYRGTSHDQAATVSGRMRFSAQSSHVPCAAVLRRVTLVSIDQCTDTSQ